MVTQVKRGVVAVTLCIAMAATAFAQTPASASRAGTGRISGRVTGTDGSGPLSSAQVRLTGAAIGNEARMGITDLQGRYEFVRLPAGQYTIEAERHGHLAVRYGQSETNATVLVTVAAGQSRDGIDLALTKSVAIAVRVTDEFGNPRAGVNVRAIPHVAAGERPKRHVAFGLTGVFENLFARELETDDRGEIRLFSLPPGLYDVVASAYEYRGYLMDSPEAASDRQLIYPPIYYPGTMVPGDAEPVSLRPGEETHVEISLVPARAAHISGRVVNPDGTPAQGYVVLCDAWAGPARFRADLSDGHFTFWNIWPGVHLIDTDVEGEIPCAYRSLTVTVAGENISDLVLTTASRGTLSGRVVFDTGVPPADQTAHIVDLIASPGRSSYDRISVNDDWTFTVEGITSPSVLRSASYGTGWYLKSVTLGGRDVTDTPLEDASDLRVLLTRTITTVDGSVTAGRGDGVSNCSVLVFSEDQGLWTAESSRFIKAVVTDQRGRFKVEGLPPGRYLAAAVPDLQPMEVPDAAYLTRLKEKASRVTLAEGESMTVSLRVVGPN